MDGSCYSVFALSTPDLVNITGLRVLLLDRGHGVAAPAGVAEFAGVAELRILPADSEWSLPLPKFHVDIKGFQMASITPSYRQKPRSVRFSSRE